MASTESPHGIQHNLKVHTMTYQSLFYLIYRYKLKDIPLAFDKMNFPTTEFWLKTLKEAQNEAAVAHELARQKMAKRKT